MSRRGGTRVDEYEERDYYSSGPPERERERHIPVRSRDLEELYARRPDDRDHQPDFLHNDYARVEDQPLVLRERKVETYTRPLQRRSPPRERSPSIERERIRTRTFERDREVSASPPLVDRTRTRVVERERDRSPDGDRFRLRVSERERDISPARSEVRVRTREVERERARSPSPFAERVRTTDRIVERERERSPSPLGERERIRTRFEERIRERQRSPSTESSISVRGEPPIIRAPPIHQEIITHHRHIDHGFDYAPTPIPTPPRPKPVERPIEKETEIDIYKGHGETEIDIHTSTRRGPARERETPRSREYYDDDDLYDREHERERLKARTGRRRSVSGERQHDRIGADESEAKFYARRADDRAYIGEAYNGATKDWAIVDVPPGTERVKMDGVGGGSQEITWQRYNGVRRSKFVPERDSQASYEREYERDTERRVGRPQPPPRNRYGDMWTEITKDLVTREAIEELGYDFEETEYFFYVIQYLGYDDVEELVRLTERIRKARRRRIREMAYEREHLKARSPMMIAPPERRREIGYEDERIYEREIIFDGGRRPRGYLR